MVWFGIAGIHNEWIFFTLKLLVNFVYKTVNTEDKFWYGVAGKVFKEIKSLLPQDVYYVSKANMGRRLDFVGKSVIELCIWLHDVETLLQAKGFCSANISWGVCYLTDVQSGRIRIWYLPLKNIFFLTWYWNHIPCNRVQIWPYYWESMEALHQFYLLL